MDKRQDFTGINPDIRLDQIQIDSTATRAALHKLMVSYAVGTNPNYIISGCIVSIGGVTPNNTWSLAEGFIFLNGEILRVDAQSGSFDSGTEFLAFSKQTTYDTKGYIVYVDGTPRNTWQVNRGIITVKGSVLATELDAINGDHIDDKLRIYIGDSSTTNKGVVEKATSAEALAGTTNKFIDAELLKYVTGQLITTVTNIGDWDMSAREEHDDITWASLGLTFANIRDVSVFIRDDSGYLLYPLNYDSGSGSAARWALSSTRLLMTRAAGGSFDSTSFNSTSYNRGYVIIRHIN